MRLKLPHLEPYPAEDMEVYPVSWLVNSPQNDTSACIAPAGRETQRVYESTGKR